MADFTEKIIEYVKKHNVLYDMLNPDYKKVQFKNEIWEQIAKAMGIKHTGLLWLFLLQYGLMARSLEPGFLDFDNLPDTNFTCVGKVIGGYYADLETNCQMFHVCTIGQKDEPMDIRFLCLNGTVFDQETRVCERIDEVDCSKSEHFYSLNLELYGNSGPILEENPEVPQETETPSLIIHSTSTTTTTTTTTKRPTTKPSPQYYTSIRPAATIASSSKSQTVSDHHFPVNNADIRFNPEEINISLNPGAPPDIRTKHFQAHQSFGGYSKLLAADSVDNDEGQSVRVQKPERSRVASSTTPKAIYAIDGSDTHRLPQNSDDDFGFPPDDFRGAKLPPRQQQFLIQTNSFRHSQSYPHNVNHNSNQYHHPQFHSTTVKQANNNFHEQPNHTTLRTLYLHSLKPPEIHQHHHYTHHERTEKTPQRVQIPIPLLPTLPPLTFSSPAPFSLQRHIDAKRYTKDHQEPPRIIISASASVSDASGRRLNYSLGTIGAAQLLESPPSSYDDYKESDVGLDPFYHDVPKVKHAKRRKRNADEKQVNPFDIIKSEKEAVEVLKFLFTWYQSHQATATIPSVTSPVSPELIRKINNELAPVDIEDSTLQSDSSEFQFINSRQPSSTESLNTNIAKSELSKENMERPLENVSNNELEYFNRTNNKSYISSEVNEDKMSTNMSATDHTSSITDADSIYSSNIKNGKTNVSNNSETPKTIEKMDNIDAITINVTKEHSSYPFDYVDDNYEGVVFKETPIISSKKVQSEKESTLEERTSEYYEKEDKHFVDPSAVSQLYEYFNVHKQIMTQTPPNFSEVANISLNMEDNLSESMIQHKKSTDESIPTHKKDAGRYTEINILSEVHEETEAAKSSSISTTTTTTTSTPKHTVRRRGRLRQRPVDSHQEASYKFNVSTQQIHDNTEKYIHVSTDRADSSKSNKRSRTRGRSRFTHPFSSSTTTTTTEATPSTTTEETITTYPLASLSNSSINIASIDKIVQPSNESSSNILDIHNDTIYEMALEEKNISSHSLSSSYVPENAKKKIDQNKETRKELGHELSLGDNGTNFKEAENTTTVNTLEQELLDSYTLDVSKNKKQGNLEIYGATDSDDTSNIKLTEKEMEDSLEPASDIDIQISTTDNPSYLIKLLRYYADTALTATNHPSTTANPEVSYDPLTENNIDSTPTPVTSSYFLETNHDKIVESQRGRNKYSWPSSRTTNSSLPTLRNIYDNTKPVYEYTDENQPANSTKSVEGLKSNTQTPDQNSEGDIISKSNISTPVAQNVEDTKVKGSLLQKLSFIQQNLADKEVDIVQNTEISVTDTTATTPIVSFEEPGSFGTTFSRVTKPTNEVNINNKYETSSKMFDISTEPTTQLSVSKNYRYFSNFYDDLFVVPELTEKYANESKEESNPTTENSHDLPLTTTKLNTNANDTNENSEIISSSMPTILVEDVTESGVNEQEVELTTTAPNVEIQKSISIPISVLETNLDIPSDIHSAYDINRLVSTDKNEENDEKVSTLLEIPTTLPITDVISTELDSQEYTKTKILENAVRDTIPAIVSTAQTPLKSFNTNTTPKLIEDHLKNLKSNAMPEVQQNATEIIFIKNTRLEETFIETSSSSPPVETPGPINSSHLLQVVVETTTSEPSVSTSSSTTSRPYHSRKTRPPRRRPYSNHRNQSGRHRFSTELFTKSPKVETADHKKTDKENTTHAPLHRSAMPTRSELKKVSLHTTPINSSKKFRIPTGVSKHYVFNCFGKETNKFYADPRDCRLFHYCTQGYSKNQLLDLKYVCDQRTFFDEDKLICTKVKPPRCL